ncbi:rab11 family-interacting protein 1-like isoform X2 [Daphnia pulicaria]|uniref:rab11 family-interacting protein 1-like isoform X2 n=1 Tax=Daphnia pulicaria TaxID=35523 RepID=UPI001EECBA29|nr:rab11 family-interacting protein 1-like isoform X2 [Daphnia pulicaria]
MWSPTHVQVTVCRVKGLLTKGKNGTNDAFVTISLGKEKFQTSVKQKALSELEWQEECELAIPTQGNTAEIVLTALHQNFIGVDEFLGMVSLPLSNFDVYERPRTKWYPLKSKPGQEGKNKNRGEIEVRVAFTVKSGSLLDLSKKEKHKGSFGHLSQAAHNIGGSLMSLGKEKKGGIKKLASSVGSKLRLPKSGRDEKGGDGRLSRHSSGRYSGKYSGGEPDPGVISEDDDEFRFDELSHKSSGSSLNLAGGSSSLASGQGSLENLGGGELLRHNSMKRSGSSATLPNRAIQPSTSISSLAVSVTSGASKSPTQQQSDWNQKFFGSKQNKVSEDPVVKEEKAGAAMTTAAMATAAAAVLHASSPPSLVADGVPSIIIQDSFVVEQPSLSPSASPPSSKLNSGNVPVPKTRNAKNQEVPVEVDQPTVIPQARQRKDLATVDEIPTMEVNSQPAGEEANAEFDTGQSLSARPRMSASPPHPSSFPVGVVMNDEHVSRPPPVPKPRRSPLPPTTSLEMLNEPLLPSSDEFPIIQQQPVVQPRNVIDVKYSPSISPIQLNPFDSESDDGQYSDSDVYDQRFEDDDRGDILDLTYNPAQPSNVIVLDNVEESDEMMLNEDSVCELLEKVIQEHDHQSAGLPAEAPPPKPVRASNAVELYNDETSEEEDEIQEEALPPNSVRDRNVVELYNDETSEEEDQIQEESIEGEPTYDFFNDQTVQISPVEKVEEEMVRVAPHQTSGRAEDTPINSSPKEIRRDRLFSLFSTPTSETDTEPKSAGVVDLDWLDDSKEDISQGFGGSEHLSDGMTAASNSDHAKTMDSAVYVTAEDNQAPEVSPSNSSTSTNFTEALNRPLSALLLAHEAVFTPPPATPQLLKPAAVQTPLSVQSTASNRAELSWDNYDMTKWQTPDAGTGGAGGRRSIVPFEPVDEEAKARRKRISLAPCLKTMALESPSYDQSAGSPITEDDEDDDGAGEQAVSANSNWFTGRS